MLDKNGTVINVGDTIYSDSGNIGIVTRFTGGNLIWANWRYARNGELWITCSNCSVVEKVTKEQQPEKCSLSQLKAQAKLEIESLIKKHTNIINQAGGSFDMHVGFYDIKTLGSDQPSQLVDVVVTVTI